MIERFDVLERSENPVFRRFMTEHRKRYMLARQFLNDLPLDSIIVDAACGCGYGYEYLNDIGLYIGLDCDFNTIKQCRKTYPLGDFRLADLECLSTFANLVPTAVVSLETAEHLQFPERFLREIYLSLLNASPHGRFVFSAPTSLTRDFDPYHLRDWSPKQWETALLNAGFRIREWCSMPFETKFTDFMSTVKTTFKQKLSVLRFDIAHRHDYGKDRWENWVLKNRFYWCSHLFYCTIL